MKEFKVKDHASSIVPDGEWELVWADEFDGDELDTTKWDYRFNMMGKRHRTWDDEGVKLDGNSNAVFTIYEKNGEICSSQLQTGHNYMDEPPVDGDCWDGGLTWPIGKLHQHKFLHKFGYYECRCKLQQMPGWWSAFWVQSPVIGSSLDPTFSGIENDIMESFTPGTIIKHCNHYNGYNVDHVVKTAGEGLDNLSLDEYHLFGMLWEEDGYTFYVDGKEDGKISGPVSNIPQFILISTEVNGYRWKQRCATDEAKEAAKAGDKFIVDYVRVFDRKNKK